jgi:aspartate 1-decarboxylase
MYRNMCHAKIHLATVTQTDLNYEGSITIDRDFMDAVDIKAYELVHVVNKNNGYRAETYVIEGERGQKTIGINGALARHAEPGDRIIIIAYKWMSEEEIREDFAPKVLYLNERNDSIQKAANAAG